MPDSGLARPFIRRLGAIRIGNGPTAWLVCSLGASLVGSTFFAVGMALYGSQRPIPAMIMESASRMVLAIPISTLTILVATAAVAPPVTWVVARLRIEYAVFHVGFGALCGFAAGQWLGSGEPEPFLFSYMAMISAPVFGAAWGFLWWLLYRRHVGKSRMTEIHGIFE